MRAFDAGAHLDMIEMFSYTTHLIQHAVREHGLMTVEQAVRLLTHVPAQLYGLRDRGIVGKGSIADVVIFDESTVEAEPLVTQFDLPTGAGRLYGETTGVPHVLVNGEPIVEDGAFTDARPGHVLRAGVDTDAPRLT